MLIRVFMGRIASEKPGSRPSQVRASCWSLLCHKEVALEGKCKTQKNQISNSILEHSKQNWKWRMEDSYLNYCKSLQAPHASTGLSVIRRSDRCFSSWYCMKAVWKPIWKLKDFQHAKNCDHMLKTPRATILFVSGSSFGPTVLPSPERSATQVEKIGGQRPHCKPHAVCSHLICCSQPNDMRRQRGLNYPCNWRPSKRIGKQDHEMTTNNDELRTFKGQGYTEYSKWIKNRRGYNFLAHKVKGCSIPWSWARGDESIGKDDSWQYSKKYWRDVCWHRCLLGHGLKLWNG